MAPPCPAVGPVAVRNQCAWWIVSRCGDRGGQTACCPAGGYLRCHSGSGPRAGPGHALTAGQQFPRAPMSTGQFADASTGSSASAFQGTARVARSPARAPWRRGYAQSGFVRAVAGRQADPLHAGVRGCGRTGRPRAGADTSGASRRVNSDADALDGASRRSCCTELWLRFAHGRRRRSGSSVGKLDPARTTSTATASPRTTPRSSWTTALLFNDRDADSRRRTRWRARCDSRSASRRYAFGVHAPDELGGGSVRAPVPRSPRSAAATSCRCPGAGSGGCGPAAWRTTAPARRGEAALSIDQSHHADRRRIRALRLESQRGRDADLERLRRAGMRCSRRGWWQRATGPPGGRLHHQRRAGRFREADGSGHWSFAVHKLLWVTADVQWLIPGPEPGAGGTEPTRPRSPADAGCP